jgi:hypothetical protein
LKEQGGDLNGALDWLVLHVEHSELPAMFTDKQYKTESKGVSIIKPI